jgi:hypothetical protein
MEELPLGGEGRPSWWRREDGRSYLVLSTSGWRRSSCLDAIRTGPRCRQARPTSPPCLLTRALAQCAGRCFPPTPLVQPFPATPRERCAVRWLSPYTSMLLLPFNYLHPPPRQGVLSSFLQSLIIQN